MVPVKLSLKNFLSYGENVPPLDFTSFHVACLSGGNGHGKSALLDAITWAIWGEARKASSERKPDDGLLRIGSTEMRVEFEFNLEGDRYRVIRGYHRTRRASYSNLEFQIYDESLGGYRSLSESSSVTKTQGKINQTLRMDYNTFINSAFILQGRADEFTKKSARERKEILADILGLSRYDELARLARSHCQEAERLLDRETARLEEIDSELENKEMYKEAIEQLDEKLEGLSRGVEAVEKELFNLQEKRSDLLNKKKEALNLGSQIEQLGADIEDAQSQIGSQRAQVDEYQDIIFRKDAILAALEEFQRLTFQEKEYARKFQDLRKLEPEKNRLEQEIQEARHKVEIDKKSWESKLSAAEETIKEAEKVLKREDEIRRGHEDLERAREADQNWESKRDQQEDLEEKGRKIEKLINDAKSDIQVRLGTLTNQLSDLEARASTESECEKALSDAQDRLERLERLEKEREEVRDRGSRLAIKIDGTENQIESLEKERLDVQEKLTILQRSPEARCPLCDTDLDEQSRGNIEAKFRQNIEENRAQAEKLKEQLKADDEARSKLRLRYREIGVELKSLPEVRRGVAQAETAYKDAVNAKEQILKFQEQIASLKKCLEEREFAREEQRSLVRIKEEIEKIGYDRAQHMEVKKTIQELGRFEAGKGVLDSAVKQHRRAVESIPSIKEEISKAVTCLEEKRYATKEQEELKKILRRIEELGYDGTLHQKVRDDLERLQRAPVERDSLNEAEEKIGPAKDDLERLEDRLRRRLASKVDLQERKAKLGEEVLGLERLEGDIADLESRRRSLGEERDRTREGRGAFQSKYDNCLKLEESRKEIEENLKKASKDRDIYEELITAFGKDGIQALIIENSIPEIEQEANEILSRLTDNKTQITIESLRDLKKGGTKETLDIKISDELGERSYETFSGGERFRTDFGLRIALSKLLAKRAGTKLRILVIDEGFGTQDSEGLEHLVEAIQAISDDFDKILVITHLEELKNAFPVRIEVEKLPETGSVYRIMQ